MRLYRSLLWSNRQQYEHERNVRNRLAYERRRDDHDDGILTCPDPRTDEQRELYSCANDRRCTLQDDGSYYTQYGTLVIHVRGFFRGSRYAGLTGLTKPRIQLNCEEPFLQGYAGPKEYRGV